MTKAIDSNKNFNHEIYADADDNIVTDSTGHFLYVNEENRAIAEANGYRAHTFYVRGFRNKYIDMHIKRAHVYNLRGEYDKSDADYQTALSVAADAKDERDTSFMINAHWGLAINAMTQEKNEEAIEEWSNVIHLDSNYWPSFYHRALSYKDAGKYAEAAADLITAADLGGARDKEDGGGDDRIIKMMAELSDLGPQMEEQLKLQIEKMPDDCMWPFFLGSIEGHRGKEVQAVMYYDMAVNKRGGDLARVVIIKIYEEMGLYDKALTIVDDMIAKHDSVRFLYGDKAHILYDMGQFEEAIACIDSYTSIDRTAELTWVDGLFQKGECLEALNRYDEADSAYFSVMVMAQLLLMDVGNERSEEYLANIEGIYMNAIYRSCRVNKLANHDVDPEILKKIIGYCTRHDIYDYRLAYAYWASGINDMALDCIKRMSTDDDVDYYNLACIYSLMGDTRAAIDNLGNALNDGYINFAHIAVDHDFDNIRNNDEFKQMIDRYESAQQGRIAKLKSAPNT
jgi:tetratricopeptide (TPR) repeat protein